jgi:hypothetical protein
MDPRYAGHIARDVPQTGPGLAGAWQRGRAVRLVGRALLGAVLAFGAIACTPVQATDTPSGTIVCIKAPCP